MAEEIQHLKHTNSTLCKEKEHLIEQIRTRHPFLEHDQIGSSSQFESFSRGNIYFFM